LRKNLLKKDYKSGSKKLLAYSNITLKTYIEISKTSNYNLLGEGTQEDLVEAWENIVKENSAQTGSYNYQDYLENLKQVGSLSSDSILIRAHLLRLCFVVSDDSIQFLKEKGYNILTTGAYAYQESIEAALRKASNLSTKITMKINEMNNIEVGKEVGLEELLAGVSVALGFAIADDITLARFNEYQKILKKRSNEHSSNSKSARSL